MGGGSDGERQDDDAAAGTGEEHLRGAEDLGIPHQLVVREALKVLISRWCGYKKAAQDNTLGSFLRNEYSQVS